MQLDTTQKFSRDGHAGSKITRKFTACIGLFKARTNQSKKDLMAPGTISPE